MATMNLDPKAATLPLFMTLQEVAEHSRFSIDTVRKAIQKGSLVASQPEGREWRVCAADFVSWMHSTTNPKETAIEGLEHSIPAYMTDPRIDPIAGGAPIVFLRLDIPPDYEGILPRPWETLGLPFSGGTTLRGMVLLSDRKSALVRLTDLDAKYLQDKYGEGTGTRFFLKMQSDMFSGLPLFVAAGPGNVPPIRTKDDQVDRLVNRLQSLPETTERDRIWKVEMLGIVSNLWGNSKDPLINGVLVLLDRLVDQISKNAE